MFKFFGKKDTSDNWGFIKNPLNMWNVKIEFKEVESPEKLADLLWMENPNRAVDDKKYQAFLEREAAKEAAKEAEKKAIEKERVIKSLQKDFKLWTEVYIENNDRYDHELKLWKIIQILGIEETQCWDPFIWSSICFSMDVIIKSWDEFFKESTDDLLIKEEIKKPKKK